MTNISQNTPIKPIVYVKRYSPEDETIMRLLERELMLRRRIHDMVRDTASHQMAYVHAMQ